MSPMDAVVIGLMSFAGCLLWLVSGGGNNRWSSFALLLAITISFSLAAAGLYQIANHGVKSVIERIEKINEPDAKAKGS